MNVVKLFVFLVTVGVMRANAVGSKNYATAATTTTRRRESAAAIDVKVAAPPIAISSSPRNVAQYELPGQRRSTTEAAAMGRSEGNHPTIKRMRIIKRRNNSTATTTTSTTTTTTTTTTPRPSLANGFNLFGPNFWNFPQQSVVAVSNSPTKYPPKKFNSKEEKQNYQKPSKRPGRKSTTTTTTTSTTTTTTTTTSRPQTDGPFRIALPTVTFNEKPKRGGQNKDKDKRTTAQQLRQHLNCPRESEVRFQLFPKICKSDKDCEVWQRGELCCEIFGAKSCVNGIPKPLEEASHAPILGLIPRKCPSRPLAELWWDVQECETDMDCWPRVCCPDGQRRYCRTSQPELETAPAPVKRSFDYLTEYLECTAPPPPIFDLHPKVCASTLDCFPNVCCQEAGKRHCRPPKKSVLTLMANVFNVDFVKRLTQNIVIK